jgi:hypothetical protein
VFKKAVDKKQVRENVFSEGCRVGNTTTRLFLPIGQIIAFPLRSEFESFSNYSIRSIIRPAHDERWRHRLPNLLLPMSCLACLVPSE